MKRDARGLCITFHACLGVILMQGEHLDLDYLRAMAVELRVSGSPEQALQAARA